MSPSTPHPFDLDPSEGKCNHPGCRKPKSHPLHQPRALPMSTSVFKIQGAAERIIFEAAPGVDLCEAMIAFRDAAARLIATDEPIFTVSGFGQVCVYCTLDDEGRHADGCPWLLFVQSFAALQPKPSTTEGTEATGNTEKKP